MKVIELVNESENNTIFFASKAVNNNGKEYDLIDSKLKRIIELSPDKIIVKKALIGEINLLKIISKEVEYRDSINKVNINLDEIRVPSNKILQIGDIVTNANFTITIGNLLGQNPILSVLPLPFRDESIDEVIIFEVLDYDVVREVYRVLKKNRKIFTIIRDKLFGGVDPILGIKVLSLKFEIIKVYEKKGYWIVEGIKKR